MAEGLRDVVAQVTSETEPHLNHLQMSHFRIIHLVNGTYQVEVFANFRDPNTGYLWKRDWTSDSDGFPPELRSVEIRRHDHTRLTSYSEALAFINELKTKQKEHFDRINGLKMSKVVWEDPEPAQSELGSAELTLIALEDLSTSKEKTLVKKITDTLKFWS